MAVQIPAVIVVGALKAIQQQVINRTNAQHNQTDLMRLKLELQDRHKDRQAAMLSQLADISSDLSKAKTDAMLEVFQGVREGLLNHQKMLGDEKASLNQAMVTSTAEHHVLIRKRQREIGRELSDIDDALLQLGDTAFDVLSAITPQLPSSLLGQIENLKR